MFDRVRVRIRTYDIPEENSNQEVVKEKKKKVQVNLPKSEDLAMLLVRALREEISRHKIIEWDLVEEDAIYYARELTDKLNKDIPSTYRLKAVKIAKNRMKKILKKVLPEIKKNIEGV